MGSTFDVRVAARSPPTIPGSAGLSWLCRLDRHVADQVEPPYRTEVDRKAMLVWGTDTLVYQWHAKTVACGLRNFAMRARLARSRTASSSVSASLMAFANWNGLPILRA